MKKIIKQSLSIPLLGEYAPVLVNLIGTCNEDGNPHLCGASFVSFTLGPPKSIVFSTFVKPTINNIERTGEFSVNMCTGEMAEISDSIYWKQELGKQNISIESFEWGSKVHVPVLNASPFVCECRVLQSYKFGESSIYFAEIVNQQIDIHLGIPEDNSEEAYVKWLERLNINDLDPLLWLGNYYRIGKKIL